MEQHDSEDSNGVLTMEVAPGVLPPGQASRFTVTGANIGSQRWFGVYLVRELTPAGRR